jgi:uncharacterized delta-60 repeat protein
MKNAIKLIILLFAFNNSYAQDGTLDFTFGINGKVNTTIGSFSNIGNAMAIQTDGKIVVAGTSHDGTKYVFTIIRYLISGAIDATFANAGIMQIDFGPSGGGANAIAIQNDNKIVVAGTNNADFALARLNMDGTLDSSFDSDGLLTTTFGSPAQYENVSSLIIQTDGKIVAAGTRFQNNFDVALARYNEDGSLDLTFDLDGKVVTAHPNARNEYGSAMALQSDNKIIVAGHITTGSTNDFQVIRYNTDGSLDTTFNFNGKVTTDFGTTHDYADAVKVQIDGKILVAGGSSNGVVYSFSASRYNANGTLDTSFDTDGKLLTSFGLNDASASEILISNDSKFILAGWYNGDFAMARFNENGTLDNSFDNDGKVSTDFNNQNDTAYAMAMQTDGKIILAGKSFSDNSASFAIARYNTSLLKTEYFTKDDFYIAPNPANDIIAIQNNNNLKIDNLAIFDISGKKILDESQNTTSLNIQALESGTYFLQILSDGKTSRNKFIKK